MAAELEQKTLVRLVVIPGAGHFFENRLDDLKRAITDWISEQLQMNTDEQRQ
jgi:alpha/beta superfamily hydrolase